jgi:hypothetical protein
MKRALIVLVVLLLVPSAADARRGKRVLVIRDYTSAAWSGVIEQTVEDFNAVMPQGAARLVYRRMETAPCTIHPTRRRRDVLDVCSASHLNASGQAHPRQQVIVLNDTYAGAGYDAHTVCHEFMHILAHVGDDEGAYPDQSCVWGSLSQPGPLDVDLLRARFRRR